MYPMDYEEFRWAMGDEVSIPLLRQCFESKRALGDAVVRQTLRDFRLYMLIGGMPQVVSEYIKTNNFADVDEMKRSIISLYDADLQRIGSKGCASLIVNTIFLRLIRYISVLKRIIILLVVLLLVGVTSHAQYDPHFSHYFDMEPSYNPAAVGKQAKVNVTAAYALSMAGFEHNPKTMYAAADVPFYLLKNYHGVGVQFMNDQIGLFKHQRLGLQYAFKRRLFKGMMSVGVQAGFISDSFDGSQVDVEESSDPALAKSQVKGSSFDLGAGIYYMHGPWYVGVSAQHLTAPKIELGETNELDVDPIYYLTGGYNIKLRNPFLSIKPSALVKYDGVTWRGDVTCRLVYTHEKKMLYGGVAYSPTNSVTGLVGAQFHGVVLGYSYEFYTSALSAGNGSHELYVGYQTDINLIKKGKNKHQSVRIL